MGLSMGYVPGLGIVLLPLYMLLAVACALGVGLWSAALSVKYRDAAYVLNYSMQAWMYASPVVYSSVIVPDEWKTVYRINPMTQVINTFRWALFGKGAAPDSSVFLSIALVAVILITGIWYFQKAERTVVDLL
jgi:lipopolysaccharide transport system permease protein